jgi:hypothetical protein
MNDVRESMWAAAADLPPTGIDLDRLIAGEDRARRRRRTVAGSALLLAVAGAAVLLRPGVGAPAAGVEGPAGPPGDGCTVARPAASSSMNLNGALGRTGPVPTEPEAVAVRRLSGVLAAALAAHLPGRTIADAIRHECAGVLFEPNVDMSRYHAQVTFSDEGGTGALTIMINDRAFPGMSAYRNVHTLPDGSQIGWLDGTLLQLGVSRPDGTQITLYCENSRGTALQGGQPAAPATVDELTAIATDPGLTLYP